MSGVRMNFISFIALLQDGLQNYAGIWLQLLDPVVINIYLNEYDSVVPNILMTHDSQIGNRSPEQKIQCYLDMTDTDRYIEIA